MVRAPAVMLAEWHNARAHRSVSSVTVLVAEMPIPAAMAMLLRSMTTLRDMHGTGPASQQRAPSRRNMQGSGPMG